MQLSGKGVVYGSQLEELVILEMVEKMGDIAKDEGEWIAKIDLVEDGKKLKLVEHEELGKCREECKTIQRAAQEVLSDYDTDIAEKLWQVWLLSQHLAALAAVANTPDYTYSSP